MNGVQDGKPEPPKWQVGLVHSAGRYLTAETFGFKLNASGTNFRKKQLWTLEHDSTADEQEEVVYLRSHLGRYLSSDKKGNVRCDSETKGDDEKFAITYNKNGSGTWAFKSKKHNLYFGGCDDHMKCDTHVTPEEWWTVRLAVHPHVNFRNVNRGRYAHLDEESQQIHVDEIIPWGADALITIEFVDGKYAVKASNNKYLKRDGSLVDNSNPECLYTLELKSGSSCGMALKDSAGKYLSALGRPPALQSGPKSKGTITKDELFTLEDSHGQVIFTAHNGKKVSFKQGLDLSANQEEVTDKETFQVEFDAESSKWHIRTAENRFWSLEQASGIQAGTGSKKKTGLFSFEWMEDGHVAIKADNDKYITAKLNGSLYASQSQVSDKEMFYMTIINRPVLILRCDYGFIGFKTSSNPRIECNKSTSDGIFLETTEQGVYYLRGANGKYWKVDGEGHINSDGSEPTPFHLEMRKQSRFTIRAANGRYLKGEQNGTVKANVDLDKATHWEY